MNHKKPQQLLTSARTVAWRTVRKQPDPSRENLAVRTEALQTPEVQAGQRPADTLNLLSAEGPTS
jgi:hypothetical protein